MNQADILLEHTMGLCKSYEDKHSSLQDKLRETSLRCKFFCLSCSFQWGSKNSDAEFCLLWGLLSEHWEIVRPILLLNEFQWEDWKRFPGASITLWVPVNWGRSMNRWFSLNYWHKEQSQARQRPRLSPCLRTSLESCLQVS